jgi:hypothetical protein
VTGLRPWRRRREESGTAAAALLLDIVRSLAADEDLAAQGWDHHAVIASVGEGVLQLNGFAYLGDRPPVPAGADGPDLPDAFRALQDATAGPDGERWDVAVVQIEAATGRFQVRYHYAPESAQWRVTPSTVRRIAEAARPTGADFD